MALTIASDAHLANQVSAKAELPPGAEVVPVKEFSTALRSPCDSTELLSWMGSMTAGPPTLAAEVLRSAGAWAWIRYRWAMEDRGEVIKPTAEARSIKKHTRSMFSETVGIGAAGSTACRHLFPSGFLTVANLDDTMEPLERSGLIRRRPNWGKRQPDYLIARHLGGARAFGTGPMELLAIECKGTIKNEKAAVGQLVRGVRQVVGIESGLPLRRVVFATTMALDDLNPVVRTHAVEVITKDRPLRPPKMETAWDAVLEAALIRALRIIGRFEQAESRLHGYPIEPLGPLAEFEVAGERVAGRSVALTSSGVRLGAEIGFDVDLLRSLEVPGPERRFAVGPAIERLAAREQHLRSDGLQQLWREDLLRDGLAVRVERTDPRSDEAL